jgi:hypothetical protein
MPNMNSDIDGDDDDDGADEINQWRQASSSGMQLGTFQH